MKRLLAVVMSVLACTVFGAEGSASAVSQYTCSLKVEPSKVSHKQQKIDDFEAARQSCSSMKTKCTTETWPVKVSFAGKDIPTNILLRAYFFGMRGYKPTVLGETTMAVKLNEMNVFKTDIVSPSVTLTNAVKRVYGVSSSGNGTAPKAKTTGERLTGSIIQLVVDGKVKKSFASKPGWKKLAQADTLDIGAIRKTIR